MPKMTPFDISHPVELPSSLESILQNHGLSPKVEDKKEKISDARKAFTNAGADLDTVASTVTHIMNFGETDNGKLKAAELVLKVHGILNEIDEKTIPIINITINGENNKSLINLVLPQV